MMPAHCAADIAPVPESVSRSISTSSRVQPEDVELRPAERLEALLARRQLQRFDRLDLERLDDGAKRFHKFT